MMYVIYGILGISVFLIIYILYENANPIKETFTIKKDLPKGLNSLKILHISDLHNYNFGEKQSKLFKLIDDDYDLIFITGDLIDRRYPNVEIAMDLVSGLKGSVFFSKGNHEKGSDKYIELEKRLKDEGVIVLDNKNYEFGDINIMGVDDPTEYLSIEKKVPQDNRKIVEENIQNLVKTSTSNFNILLSHRPEYFDIYVNNKIDLVFSGHTHGGQVRILNKGLFAANQGFFAKYTGGIFEKKTTTMVNSRGLGNNFPFAKRVFNRPHILEINLINKN